MKNKFFNEKIKKVNIKRKTTKENRNKQKYTKEIYNFEKNYYKEKMKINLEGQKVVRYFSRKESLPGDRERLPSSRLEAEVTVFVCEVVPVGGCNNLHVEDSLRGTQKIHILIRLIFCI